MRYALLGQIPVGKTAPVMQWPANGVIRISELAHYQRARGDFRLKFPGGEHTEQSFDVDACQ
jgi:hypothetical protein